MDYHALHFEHAHFAVDTKRFYCKTGTITLALVSLGAMLLVLRNKSTQTVSLPSTELGSQPSASSVLSNHDNVLLLQPGNYQEVLRGALPPAFKANFSDGSVQLDVNVYAGQIPRQMWGGRHGFQFTEQRAAVLLMPGSYPDLTIELGYYVTVHGLGYSPTDVRVKAVQSSIKSCDGQFTSVFWKGVENLSVMGDMRWWVSQATFLRRVVVHGDLTLDGGAAPPPEVGYVVGWASGGYIADSIILGTTVAGGQQQWFARSSYSEQDGATRPV
jgi:hypothetical protein